MSADPTRAIAQAVLYEGYLLWPYRRSALKNQQRFTFGGVYPRAFARLGGDRSRITMECLLEAGPGARVEVLARFLHLACRQPARIDGGRLAPVDELLVEGRRHVAFQEATEREATSGWTCLDELSHPKLVSVEEPAGEAIDPLAPGAALVRRWQPLQGLLSVRAQPLREGVVRLSVGFENRTTWCGEERTLALERTFLSTHLVARARAGAFVSQVDPPRELMADVTECSSDGLWPVLVGDRGRRDTLLGSPIILEEYPYVAPESPGDLFDGGEIDALLIHSIRGLSDAEREEMAATDPRAAQILERSLALEDDQMLRLYGAVREMRPLES